MPVQSDTARDANVANRRDFLRQATGRARATAVPTGAESLNVAAVVPTPGSWADPRLRLLRRATNGLRSGDVLDVKNRGYQQWLNEQVYYTQIDDDAVEATVAQRWPLLSQTEVQLAPVNAGTVRAQLQDATLYRAAYSRRQLYERMVEFWSDHFNISIDKVGYLKAIDDREVIRKHAMGKFGDLLKASAHSPAMLAYLDQNLSRVGSPNQNYARELMELHTIGVDGGYTQTDVEQLSRVFTGWTISGAGTFFFNASRHDFGAKTVLGVQIPATPSSTGAAGINEGEMMLDVLINHPSTARYIATKLLKWFITPEPTETQISAIAGAFKATGGDIKRVVRAVLNEGFVTNAPAKLKRPFHLVASGLRATNAVMTTATSMTGQVRVIGQPQFQYETPDGYPDLMEYWVGNVAPRWAFGTTLANSASATTLNVDVAPYLAGTPDAAIDRIQTEFFGGEMATHTREALLSYLRGGTFNATRVRETIALALCSYEFQWY
jgi:uncharacterized protein (DUF1800 family)